MAEWFKRSRSDQEVAGTNPSYDSVFDAASLSKLLTSGIASTLMQLVRREPGVNLINNNIIIIIKPHNYNTGGCLITWDFYHSLKKPQTKTQHNKC